MIQNTTTIALNATYQIEFHGPAVACGDADSQQKKIIDKVIADTSQQDERISRTYTPYFAFVPDLTEPGRPDVLIDREKYQNKSSNELWISVKRNGTGWTWDPIPTCPITEYLVCRLVNSTYHLTVNFTNGRQVVSGSPPTFRNNVAFRTASQANDAPGLVQLAYSAVFWAFSDLLIGSAGFYEDITTDVSTRHQYQGLDTRIRNTALLGSPDLACFFVLSTIFAPPEKKFDPPSAQRSADIQFARNQPFKALIPELAFNITVSLMSDLLLT